MKYKIGEKVVLNKIGLTKNSRSYEASKEGVKIVGISNGVYKLRGSVFVDDNDIDHEKTAELNKRTLEHIVAKKNKLSGMERYLEMCMDGTISFDDPVNHPSHYKQGGIETLDIIKAVTTGYSGYEGSLVANIVKYLARANFKGAKEEDIKKAQFYMNKLVEEVANDTTTENTD